MNEFPLFEFNQYWFAVTIKTLKPIILEQRVLGILLPIK